MDAVVRYGPCPSVVLCDHHVSHPTLGIVGCVPANEVAGESRLFLQFAVQGLFGCLTRFEVTSRDFPSTFWMLDKQHFTAFSHHGARLPLSRHPRQHESRLFVRHVLTS